MATSDLAEQIIDSTAASLNRFCSNIVKSLKNCQFFNILNITWTLKKIITRFLIPSTNQQIGNFHMFIFTNF